jgi:hypothetical protein
MRESPVRTAAPRLEALMKQVDAVIAAELA